MQKAADRVQDPEERQRLQDKARRLEEQSKRESDLGSSAGIDPM